MQNSVAKKIFAVGSAAAMALSAFAPFAAQAAVHAVGTNVSSTDGTVWMITSEGTRRAYTSAGAFLSYGFNSWSQVVPASSEDLALPVGSFIPPQDGSIICSDRGADKGTCYFVSGGMKYGFTSAAVFTGLGFSFANSMPGDVSWMSSGASLINSSTMAHLPGTLVNNNGTVQLVGGTGLLGVPDLATFNSWGYSFGKVVPANAADKAMAQTGVMTSRTAGMLSPTWTTSNNPNPGTPVTSGAVTVSLSSDTPASGVIVSGQATANLANFTFTGNGVVNSVILNRSGISDQSTLSNVYLYDGVTRLTDGYSFNNNGTLTMNNLNLSVNGSRKISVKADVYSAASSGQTIAVTLGGFMTTGQSAVSSASLMGNTMSVATGSGTLAAAAFTSANTVSSATVNAGTTNYTVWRQPLQVNLRTLQLKAANFRVTGSAQSNALANAKLYVDGVSTGATGMMTYTNGSNYITFDMTSAPFSLTTGNHTVEVRADVVAGASYNVTVALQQVSDLMVYDSQIGVNVAVNFASYSTTAGTITIGAGSSTIVVDPTFNTQTNVTGGASNVTIAKFKIHGYGEDVKVTSLPVLPILSTTTPSASGLQNLTLYFNGSQVGTQVNWTSATTTFSLGSQLIIPANVDSTLEVRADLRTTGGSNYTDGYVSANLGAGTAEGVSSKSTITLPTANGTQLTIQTGLLSVSENSGYANQTQNPNTSGVKIGSFVLQNQSSSESVRVTSLTVNPVGAGSSAVTNLSGLRTSETSGNGSVPQQPTTSNTFSVDFVLAAGANKTIDIFADTSSATGVTVIPTLNVTALGVTSNVNAYTAGAVTGQTITLSSGTLGTPTLLTAASTQDQYIAAGDPSMSGTGATDGTQASFQFNSTGGASTITELKFVITGTVASNTVMSVKVGNVSAPVVNVGGLPTAWLQGLNLAVPNGGAGLQVNALVTYSPVGTSGVTPTATSITTLTYVKYTSGGATTVATPSVSAPTMTLVGSKPTVTVNSTQATGLILGAENKIGEVTIAADAKGNIKINDIRFSVGSANITTFAITSPRIAIGNTTVSGSSCGANAATTTAVFCEFATSGNVMASSTVVASVESNVDFDGLTVSADQYITLSLYGTVGGTQVSGSTPSVSTSVTASAFNWDDTSAAQFVADGTTASPASGTNLNGTLIYNFPTSSYSIRQ